MFRTLRRALATEATFKTYPFRLHRLDRGPAEQVTLKRAEALVLYERMTMIRRLEATVNGLYQAKIVLGFCHLYSGQEAVAVGVYDNLRRKDAAITTYRNHAWAFLFNHSNPACIIAELIGVKSGCEKGKGGSMHLYGENFYGGNAIVGAQVPLGVGLALAHKYKQTDAVCVTIYGDGASNSGQVYEAYNMAKLWDVPCLFLCENNQYSMGTSVPRSTVNPEFFKRGESVPGIWVDGMDVVSVREAARFAHAHCASGKGPIILEAFTYRYFGHSLSDPGTSYRTHDEVQLMRQTRDPITSFAKKIIEASLVTQEELKQLDKKAKDLLDQAVKMAKNDKPLAVEELTYDIYANEVIKEVRGVDPSKMLVHKASGKAFNLK